MELADAWMLDQPIWQAMWGGRAESPRTIAGRAKDTVDVLTALGGVFGDGWIMLDSKPIATNAPESLDAWTELVEHSRRLDDAGIPVPIGGHRFSVTTTNIENPDLAYATVTFDLGTTLGNTRRAVNRVHVEVYGRGDSVSTYSALAPVGGDIVKLLASVWHPDSVELMTMPLVNLHARVLSLPASQPRIGPVSWLSLASFPALADLQIFGVTTERYGDGVLLYIGSREDPSEDVDTIASVVSQLIAAGALHASPADQAGEPRVPVWLQTTP